MSCLELGFFARIDSSAPLGFLDGQIACHVRCIDCLANLSDIPVYGVGPVFGRIALTTDDACAESKYGEPKW